MRHYGYNQTDERLSNFTGWNVIETTFDPALLHHKETVFTLGNGYLGTRGTFEEGYPQDSPATLINGVYDNVEVANTELANCPNWLPLKVKIAGELFRLDSGEILSYERRLDMRLGVLSRDVRWRSPTGHRVDFHFERFASLADKHVLASRLVITSQNFAGEIEIEALFNPEPDNQGFKHWQTINHGGAEDRIWLHTQTRHSGMQLGMAARLVVEARDAAVNVQTNADATAACATFTVQPQETVTATKIVTIFTSRETETPAIAAQNRLNAASNYSNLLAAHIATWAEVWHNSDIAIAGDNTAQLSIRYNIFQLLAVAPRHDNQVSIPAKTLSGFAYRGHVFWDTEIFIQPLMCFTQPALARNLLSYRYHTLPGARRKAQAAGYEGAMFAWESAATGDEVTPRWVPSKHGELIRIWCGDIELHINADIAYAAWQYWQTTGDDEWMRNYGAELILDTAVFWGSRVEWNQERHTYELRDVIGPDENHEHVDNNAFTNILVQWHLQAALAVWDWLKHAYPDTAAQLEEQLNLSIPRLDLWAEIQARLYVSQDPETGLIEQFEGFFQLEDVNLADYEPRTKSMQALLGIEATDKKQILKQPDVLMLLYLLRERFDHKTLQANWDYYTPRTDHSYGSSLGPAINAILACDLNQPEEAYTHFMRAALVDLEDVRGNAAEGIHAASAGAIWQAVVYGFAGVRMTPFGPIACPKLPPNWQRLKFRLQWQNEWYEFDLRQHHESQWESEENISVNWAFKGVIFNLDGVMSQTEDLLPGVGELLQQLKAAGVKVALGSSSQKTQAAIASLGIAQHFDAIAAGNSVTQPKPAPDLFLFAAQQLGVEPHECVVVEDALVGIEAALAAGMKAVGLGGAELVGKAHIVLPHLVDVTWEDLHRRLAMDSQAALVEATV